MVILFVDAEMGLQPVNPVSQQRDLYFRRTGISRRALKILHNLGFLLSLQGH
jgi:hypothetical protein